MFLLYHRSAQRRSPAMTAHYLYAALVHGSASIEEIA
jgi:hypothetical protein